MSAIASQNSPHTLLNVDHLSIDFWSQHRWINVVNDVSFSLKKGEAFGLVGESGCGKTTTAYTLLGYRRPNSRIREGQIQFDGQDLLSLSSSNVQRIRGKRVSLIPQNPTTALSPGMSIGNQILEVLDTHMVDMTSADRHNRVFELLAQVQLPEPERTSQKYPHQLSGGQQQRVIIAMALACKPDLLVLDEPTTGLDVTTQAQILELLNQLRASEHMSMVYVTHDLGVLSLICDRVGVMYAGELIEDAPTSELFANPRHPYTRGLIASVHHVTKPSYGRSVLLRGYLQREQLPNGCRFAPRCDYAQDTCFSTPQILESVVTDHRVACSRWQDIPVVSSSEPSTLTHGVVQTSHDSLLEINQIDCSYDFAGRSLFVRRKSNVVVRQFNLTINRQETVALVGESGSGKSTIARAVAGLITPTAGRISFQGENITIPVEVRNQQQRRDIQLVFQNPDASLNPRQPVSQIIGQPLRIFFGMTGSAQRKRIEELLQDVRLDSSYVNRYPDELSGGERQRVAIARALAAEPKLMLCDEILSALDVSVQASVLELLRSLQSERDLAYLFISHDLAVVRTLAHRVGVLYQGELCEVGLVEEVYAPPYHPYTHMLFSAVPEVNSQHTTSIARYSVETNSRPKSQSACPFADRCPWKVGSICNNVPPPWQPASSTHGLKCHIPLSELRDREIWAPQVDGTIK